MNTNKIFNLMMAIVFAFSLLGMPASALAQDPQTNCSTLNARDFLGIQVTASPTDYKQWFTWWSASGSEAEIYADATWVTASVNTDIYPEVSIQAGVSSGAYRVWIYQAGNEGDRSLETTVGTDVPVRTDGLDWLWVDVGTHAISADTVIKIKAVGAFVNHGQGFPERRGGFMSLYLTTDLSTTTSPAIPDGQSSISCEVMPPTNTPPVITKGDSTSVTMSQNGLPTSFDLTLHATDVDADTLTWSISSPASHGTASASGIGESKSIGYTPETDYLGLDSFIVQVDDGNGGTDTITVRVGVQNYPPGFTAWYQEGFIAGWGGWPIGTGVTLSLDNLDTAQNPDYTSIQYVAPIPWDPDNAEVEFQTASAIEIKPGFLITLSDGVNTKSTVVPNLTVTAVNVDLDIITGTGQPGAGIYSFIYDPLLGFIAGRGATVGETGTWSMDFSVANNPGEEIYNIVSGDQIETQTIDTDGDITQVRWFVPAGPFSTCADVTEIPQAECEALVALYNSTDGANWTNHTDWLQTSTLCSWYGVNCFDLHVQALYLGSNQLSGSIPTVIGNLSNLQRLYLGGNQLSGSIPTVFGNLSNLQTLHLFGNQLSGNIPTELGNLSNLQNLNLMNNQLSGNIPTEIGNLSSLQILNLSSNQLSGSVPTELGNLSSLQTLNLSNNQLNGGIPTELGNLSSLQILSLYNNQLSGSIPTSIGNLPSLQIMRFNNNQLSGSIPASIGNLSNLQILNLGYNEQLSGSIPSSIGNLSNLQALDLRSNQLSGNIPPELSNLSNLQVLCLYGNQLSGSIPPEIGNLSNLVQLLLHGNQLSGSIPPEIGNLSNLQDMTLSWNQLTGNIPPQLGNLSNLNGLFLHDNLLSGSIPPELGSLTLLTELGLSGNKLSGSIPTEISNLSNLQILALDRNQLTGNLPSDIGNLTNLTELYTESNQLSGEIPSSITNLIGLTNLTLSCGLNSTDPIVIAFLDEKSPGWQANQCLPNPIIKADPAGNIVHVYGWPNGTPLTLTVGSETFEATVGPAHWNPNEFVAEFDLEGFNLQAGQLITVTDNGNPAIVHTYIPTDLTIIGFGPGVNTMSGIATPGVEVRVCFRISGNCVTRYATTDENGNWTVDYSGIGVIPGSTKIYASEDDANGNGTMFNWRNPFFWVWPKNGASIETLEWPMGDELSLTIDNPETQANPDYGPYTQTVGTPPWPNAPAGQTYADFGLPFDIPSGYVITITNGVMTRTHTVTPLDITNVDLDTNIVTGVATPNSEVEIDYPEYLTVTADENGMWTADFNGIYEFTYDTSVEAFEYDADGDFTAAWRSANHYTMIASPYQDWVDTFGWPDGTSLTMTIGAETFHATVNSMNGDHVFNLRGVFDLQAGQQITITDNGNPAIVRTYTPTNITITGFNVGTNTMFGAAAPDTEVRACFRVTESCTVRYAIADENGDWSVDYGGLGVALGSTRISITEEDWLRNRTHFAWRNPFFWVWPNDGASIQTLDWPVDAELALTIDNPETPENPDYGPYVETVGTPPWPNPPAGQTYAGFDFPFDIPPGYVITITDGTMTRTHTVAILEVQGVDPETDVIAGIATPNATVEIEDFYQTTVDDYGHWSADISDFYDILPDTIFIQVGVPDDDGDLTFSGGTADCCHIIAFTSPSGVINRVGASGWPIGAQLTLTIEGVEGSFPATVMDDGSANFNLSGFEFQPGQLITVMDDSVPPITRTYTPTDISITGFDIGANMLLGEAAPGAKIRACFGASPITCVARYDIADANGNWSIDYSGLGVIPGSTTIRISESELSYLHVRGNRTQFAWRNPFFWVWPKNGASIETLEWPMGAELTLSIDNPGTQANPDYGPYTQTVGTPPWPNPPAGQTYTRFEFPFDIPPGYVITITNGVMTRTHTVTVVEVTSVDANTNIVTGIATPGREVEVGPDGNFDTVTADENGNWSIDFTSIYDIGPDSWVEAFENDDDGDFTAAGLSSRDTDGDGTTDLLDPCPDDTTNTCDQAGSAADFIGVDGGTLATENGRVTLNVPAGSLDSDVILSITDMGSGYELVSDQGPMTVVHSYSIQPNGTQFDPPASITFRWEDVDDDGIVDGTTLQEADLLLVKDGIVFTTSCAANPGCNMTTNELTVEVSSLSLFALAVPVEWTLKGFYQPVDMNGVYNIVKGGSTVPLKFEVFDGSIELTDVASIKSLTYAQTTCYANAITDEIETTATGDTSLRYDLTAGQFIYNWKTPKTAGICYRVKMTTSDDSSLVAYFKLK